MLSKLSFPIQIDYSRDSVLFPFIGYTSSLSISHTFLYWMLDLECLLSPFGDRHALPFNKHISSSSWYRWWHTLCSKVIPMSKSYVLWLVQLKSLKIPFEPKLHVHIYTMFVSLHSKTHKIQAENTETSKSIDTPWINRLCVFSPLVLVLCWFSVSASNCQWLKGCVFMLFGLNIYWCDLLE